MTPLLSLLPFPRYLSPANAVTSSPLPPLGPSSPTTILTCLTCHMHLTPSSSIISKTFTGRHGSAYLLTSSSLSPATVVLMPPQQRQLVTGVHTVRDFKCRGCGQELGWRYDAAEEKSQRYKVGKWILEREKVRGVKGAEGVVEMEVESLLGMEEEGEWEVLFNG